MTFRRASASLPKKVTHPPKLVLSSEICMALLKPKMSLATKFCASSKLMVQSSCLHAYICLPMHFASFVGLAPEIPEDLYHLIKKAVSVRKHLERNRKDKDSKYRLILIESRVHRLARYYKTHKQLPSVWKYEASSASALVA